MNLSAGKFFKKLFTRKQSAPTKILMKSGYVREEENAGKGPGKNRYGVDPEYHNNLQKQKSKRVAKSRKANKLARKQRKLNVKKGGKK